MSKWPLHAIGQRVEQVKAAEENKKVDHRYKIPQHTLRVLVKAVSLQVKAVFVGGGRAKQYQASGFNATTDWCRSVITVV